MADRAPAAPPPIVAARTCAGSLVAIALLLFLAGAGSYPFVDGDAAFYGRVARNAAEHGQWVRLQFGPDADGYQVDKPPLAIWLTAISFAVAGSSELAARVPHGLLAVLLVIVATGFARRKAGDAAGLAAGLVLTTSSLLFYLAREPMTDVPLALAVMLTIDLADRFARSRRIAFFLLACAAGAAGVLIKGPIGLVLPATILLADALLAGRRVSCYLPGSRWHVAVGPAIFLVLVVPWHAAVFAQNGWSFAANYGMAVTGQGWLDERGVPGLALVAYPGLLLVAMLPWTGVLLAAIAGVARGRGTPLDRLAVVWLAVAVILFSLAAPAHIVIRYLISVLPAAALLAGGELTRCEANRLRLAGALTICVAIVVVASALALDFGDLPQDVAAAGRRAALSLACVMVAGGICLAARRAVAGIATLALGASVVYMALVVSAPRIVNELYPARRVAALVNDRSHASAHAAIFRADSPDLTMLAFYLDRPLHDCSTTSEMSEFVSRPGEKWVIEVGGRPLPPEIRSQLDLAAQYPNGMRTWRKRTP